MFSVKSAVSAMLNNLGKRDSSSRIQAVMNFLDGRCHPVFGSFNFYSVPQREALILDIFMRYDTAQLHHGDDDIPVDTWFSPWQAKVLHVQGRQYDQWHPDRETINMFVRVVVMYFDLRSHQHRFIARAISKLLPLDDAVQQCDAMTFPKGFLPNLQPWTQEMFIVSRDDPLRPKVDALAKQFMNRVEAQRVETQHPPQPRGIVA